MPTTSSHPVTEDSSAPAAVETEAPAVVEAEPDSVTEAELAAVVEAEPPAIVEASEPAAVPSAALAGEPLPIAEAAAACFEPRPAQLESAPIESTGPDAEIPGKREPELHFPTLSGRDELSWPIGERRSSARQARKPLPAALQAVVASDLAQSSLGEPATPSASRQAPEPSDALLGATGVSAETNKEPVPGDQPGIIRRYASAIAIVVLFAAAGGAAAGIASFRGPVSRPNLPSAAQDKAAANRVALRSRDFPPSWHVSGAGFSASSYGFGSVFATPAVLNSWLNANPSCATDLNSVSAAVTASAGSTTAEAATQAASSDPLDGSWQAADVVAFHTSASQLRNDLTAMRSLLADPSARACIDRYWSAALLARMPAGSQISLSVSQPAGPGPAGEPALVRPGHGGHRNRAQHRPPLPFRGHLVRRRSRPGVLRELLQAGTAPPWPQPGPPRRAGHTSRAAGFLTGPLAFAGGPPVQTR